LLRTPTTATLAVAEVPLPPVPDRLTQAALAQRASLPAAEPAPAVPVAAAPIAAAPAAMAQLRVASPVASPAVAEAAGDALEGLEEPEWLRADDPPERHTDRRHDRGVDASTERAPQRVGLRTPGMPAHEPTPPWDDEAPDTRPAPHTAVAPVPRAGVQAIVAGHQPQVVPDAAPRAAPVHVERPVTSRWLSLMQPVFAAGRLNGFVRELAWQSECLACEGAELSPGGELRVTLRVARESLRQTQLRDRLQATLADQFGCPVSIEVSAGAVADSAALRDAAARGKRQADAEVLVHNHPLVKSLLAALPGARILPGSIRPTGTPS
jgi:DNA polymerase-3 subunit gamma/tau